MLGGNLPTGTVSSSADHHPRPRDPGSPANVIRSERPTRRRESIEKNRPGPGETRGGNHGGEQNQAAGAPAEARTRAELQEEIAELEERLEAYETREQQVIDRYEHLLDEQRRRQSEAEGGSRVMRSIARRPVRVGDVTRPLRRTKRRLLQTLGLR